MKFITRQALREWTAELVAKNCLVAPVDSEGKLVYQKISDPKQICLDFERTDLSPKTWLYPMSEAILQIVQGKNTRIEIPPVPKKLVLFAVRPCDARAVLALDALFLDKQPVDQRYASYRASTTLVGMTCPQMWSSCFCTAVGGSPESTDGLDILLTETADGFIVDILTEKGKEIITALSPQEKAVALKVPQLKQDLPTLRNSEEWNALFNDTFWKKLSNSCLSCRVCSFVCPTCRCYDVRDELIAIKPESKEFERIRAWDSCTPAGYRRIAGGHNPRDTQEKRLRNRFYCKFVYYPDDFGPMGCVGCGRCIDACPTGINILEVIEEVNSLAEMQNATD